MSSTFRNPETPNARLSSPCHERVVVQTPRCRIALPSTVTDGHVVGVAGWRSSQLERCLADSASAEPTSATATTTTPSAVAATAAAATVSSHLSKTRINLLLGLLENIDEITSLLLVWRTD